MATLVPEPQLAERLSLPPTPSARCVPCSHMCPAEGAAATPWTAANAMERSWGTARSPEGSEPEPPAAGSFTLADVTGTCWGETVHCTSEPPEEEVRTLETRQVRSTSLAPIFHCRLCRAPLSPFFFFGCAAWQMGFSSLTGDRTCSPLQWTLAVLITGPHQGGPCPVLLAALY